MQRYLNSVLSFADKIEEYMVFGPHIPAFCQYKVSVHKPRDFSKHFVIPPFLFFEFVKGRRPFLMSKT